MNFFQEIGLADQVFSDISAFAAGQSVGTSIRVGSDNVSVSVVHLPNGPVSPYTEISGSFISIFLAVLADASAIASGAPVSLAVKIGNSWYGVTLQLMPSAPAAPAPAIAA